jgi:outer membrane biogenesis lipoprotein LolB
VLWLIGPLGNTLARVDITPTGVRWQDAAGKRGEAADLRVLGQSLAGIVLPEAPAEYWLHARWPANDIRQRDASSRAVIASARDWQFIYRYGPPAPEGWPLALEAAGPDGLWLRLALTEWNGVSDPAEQPTP